MNKKLTIFNSDKIMKTKFKPLEFVINALIPEKGITIVSGHPGSGKSWILLKIAQAIGRGDWLFKTFQPETEAETPEEVEKYMRFSSKQLNVLYVDEESSFQEIQRRWKRMRPSIHTQVSFTSMEGLKLDNKDWKEELLRTVEAGKYDVLILDSLIDFHSKNENDATDAQYVIDCLREFTRKGVTVIVAHHQRKEIMGLWKKEDPAQMLRGSSAFLGGLDGLIAVEKVEETDKRMSLMITQAKLRQGKRLLPFKVNISDVGDTIEFEYMGEVENEATKRDEVKELIVEFIEEIGGNTFQQEVVDKIKSRGYSPITIRRSWKEMKEAEIIVPLRKVGRKTYYGVKD